MKRDIPSIVATIANKLREASTPERAEHEKRYLKSSLLFIGATMPTVNLLARHFHRKNRDLTREEMLSLVDRLWSTDTHELRSFAIELMCLSPELLNPDDLPMLERQIRESAGWAHVDEISAHVVGGIVLRHPEALPTLDRWAEDADFWVRRASMLSLLIALRSGNMAEWPRFCGYAAAMIEEKEFFIRKAIGWVLRDVSKRSPEPVIEFLRVYGAKASGLTRREASKYLTEEQRKRAGFRQP